MDTTFKYDHYYKYDEIKTNLEYFKENYPDLLDLKINMVTDEGRNQYAVIITNKKTGDYNTKPALYIDGNIHAGEVTSAMCAMHTIDYLVTNYGKNNDVTKLLNSKTFYVIPRVSPDGAEKYLSTPYTLRSVPKDYNTKQGGIKSQDLDDDGVIRMMRIKTPYGAWKIVDNQMTLRSPSDIDGDFYDIYPEGVLEEYDDSENLKLKKASWGLDFNRNFPLGWFPDSRQPGAGKYPLSNPETKALVDFVLSHNNIGGAAIGHTSGGMILIPPGTRPEKSMPEIDRTCLNAIATMAEEELGYVKMNIFDSFMSDQEQYDSGAFDDWCYQSQGIPAYTMEFWDVAKKAGQPRIWNGKPEDTLTALKRYNAILNWVKDNAPQYLMDWKEIDHPTFGKVEIGGYDFKYTVQNPPENMLLEECENDTKFNIRFAKSLPSIKIESLAYEKIGEDICKVNVLVGNRGYLATNLTNEANKLNVSTPVKVSIEGCELISGKQIEEIGNLDGFSGTTTGSYYDEIITFENAKAKKKLSWVIKAKQGSHIKVCAYQEKAGIDTKEIELN